MFLAKKARLLVAASVIALVAACDTAEERAEKHYQNSIELIESGDVDRALVELRNVFQLDEAHREARTLYASQMLKLGRLQEAYGHYLRLVERYPDEVEGRVILADLALDRRQWEEVERHGARAIELAPDDPRVEVVEVALAYRAAIQSEDASARREAARRAEELFERMPEEPSLAALLVESYASDGNFSDALEVTNRAIPVQPDNQELYLLRLGLLEQLGDVEGLEQYLVELNERFPDEAEYQQMILRYYMASGQAEAAEEFFRSVVSPEDEDLGDYASFVRFIRNNKGVEAAIAELNTALQVRPGEPMLTALAASLKFDNGDRDEAISQLETLLETAEPNADTRRFKVALARMLLATENEVGARKLVEEVLAEDGVQVDAIKLQATWMITDDRSNEAISLLRRALDSAPDDFQLMTLMAQAHARNGDRALARDLLSLAAETSGFAPEESVRYARALIDEEEFNTAETTLVSSLRARPDTLSTLVALAEVYIRTEDWSRAEQVERNLRRIGTEPAVSAADRIRLALLNRQDRSDEAIAFLEGQFQDSSGDTRALAVLIQSYLQAGDTDRAREALDTAMLENPDVDDLVFFDAALKAVEGDLPAAEQRYRMLLEEYPTNERLWLELIRIVSRQQDPEAVKALVDEGLEALPDSSNLLWAKASRLERELDIDGAIEIYERIYAQANSSVVAANNLASLLATYRGDDADNVDRAYRIARRLRGTENPAFQDTYGWIAYLNGEYSEALEYLEPAAANLTDDPIVQYHLGMAYLASERQEDAIAQFQRALEIAGANDPREQFVTAREKLAELQAAPATQPQ
ncbi:tetratricopeptide repeat protein [Tropicimonas sp. S265A]|uniref:tetratricopeptide repeat protein n=1 Tax=Tropicimonas sp. S265A TaxID=3415134 RepID=UPI003C7A620B